MRKVPIGPEPRDAIHPQDTYWPEFWPIFESMQTLPLSQVKDRLSALVDSAMHTQDGVLITRNGTAAAVLIGIDEWESIQETLFWLSDEGAADSLTKAEADVATGSVAGEDEIRAQRRHRER